MTGFFVKVREQRRGIVLTLGAVLAIGAWCGRQLPSSILPEVTFPRITILADSGELPSDAMMRAVTRPLEESIRRVPGVLEVRSATSRGSAEINLDCAWTSDMNLTLQRVQAQMDATRARLPAGTTLDSRIMNASLFPFLGISMVSNDASLAQLRDFAVTVLTPELGRLPGVAEVVVQGGRKLEARVSLDPAALQARGLDAQKVADAIRGASVLESVGLLESNQEFYLGLADGRPTDLATLSAVPIPVATGPPVPLSRLGRVQLEEAPEFTRYRAQNREAVLVNILRQPGASGVTMADAIHRWFEDNRGRLPRGVHVETFYDQSQLVRESANSVRDSLLVGLLLAVVIIIVFLRSLRLGLAGALVLPFTIAGTLIGLSLMHQSLNMMTLGGIAAAVGLVLDDAIVVVEHLAARTVGAGAVGRSEAMAEILPTLVGSSLCTLAILAPFVALDGVTGSFFRVLSLSMALMLGTSLMLCLTLVPLTSPTGHSAKPPATREPGRMQRAWDGAMRYATTHVFVGIVAVLLCVGLAVPLYLTLGTGFLPEMDEGALIIDFLTPPGSSLNETDRILTQVDRAIAATPEVLSWSRRTGDQLGFFLTESNHGDYVLRLKKQRSRSADEVADDLRQRVEKSIPAVELEFGQLVEDVIGDLTSNPQPIEVRVFSEDHALAQAKAGEVAELIGRIPGVVDVKSGVVVSGPTVIMTASPGAGRLGLSAADLARAAAPAVAGLDAGEIVRGTRAWNVRLVLPRPEGVSGPAALAAIPVAAATNGRVPLGEVANLKTNPGETEIARDNLRIVVPVTARLTGRDLGSAMSEIQRRIRAGIVLPPDVTIRYAGLWAEQQSSFKGLQAVLVGALILVMLILLFSFRSWLSAGAVLLVVASSLAGVLGALHLGGATFNISSFVGAIMMVGIVSENAYFLVDEFQSHLAAGLDAHQAALAAARRRTRPVLMTTFAGVAALAPLALGFGAGSALLKPLAIAVVGGFVTSAFLLLLVLPSLLGRHRNPAR